MPAKNDATPDGLPFDLGVFDLDGTVLRRDLRITARTINSIQRLRERGMRLVVATGRHFESAREHAYRLGFGEEDPMICYGGSMVRRLGGETLLHRTVPRGLAIEVVEWAANRGLHARIFLDGRIVTSPRTPPSDTYIRAADESGLTVVESLSDFLASAEEEPIKLVYVDEPDDVGGWLEDARSAFSGRLFVTRSLPHYVEVGSLEGMKSRGLEFVCEMWGIDPARALAFGDADNDLDMLRFAGRGVAVGGMTGEVREAADVVAPPVNEDGVARYLESLLEEA